MEVFAFDFSKGLYPKQHHFPIVNWKTSFIFCLFKILLHVEARSEWPFQNSEWMKECVWLHSYLGLCVRVSWFFFFFFFFLKSRDTETGRQTELISSFPLQMPVIDRAGPAWCWRAENSIQVSYVGERGPATGATYLRVSSWLELRVELRLQPRHLDMRFAVPTGILTPMPHAHPRLDSLLKERGLRWEHRQEVSYNDIFIFRYFPRKSY